MGDKKDMFNLASRVIENVTGVPSPSDIRALDVEMTERWYESHAHGSPDYSGYSDPVYPWLALDCWRGWSCGTVKFACDKFLKIVQPRSVADLGAGIGLTTVMLSKALPLSTVIYHNIADSPQWEVAAEIFEELDCHNVVMVSEPVNAEAVVASEYLEHIIDPLMELESQLTASKAFIDISSFTLRSHGHEPTYRHGTQEFSPRQMRITLSRSLRADGWRRVRRGYNGRPMIYVRSNKPDISTQDQTVFWANFAGSLDDL